MIYGLKWVNYGTRSGWMRTGNRPGALLCPERTDGWAKAVRVACAAEGGQIDMVQCYDAGILSAGPLGANLASRSLDRLAGYAMLEVPEVFSTAFTPAYLGEPLAWVGPEHDPISARLSGFDGTDFQELTDDERRLAVFGPDHSQEQSRLWVDAWVRVLTDPMFDPAVMSASVDTMKRISGYAFGSIPHVPSPVDIAVLSFAVNNPAGAEVLWRSLRSNDWQEVISLAASGRFGPKDANGAPLWPSRVERTRIALEAEL